MDANHTYELIEKYCLDLMDGKEKLFFEMEMSKNPALAEAVKEYQILLNTIHHIEDKEFVSNTLQTIHKHSRSQTDILLNNLKLHVNKYWRTASVAASVALLASVLTLMVARSVYKKDNHAIYQTLRKEIISIKNNQKAIKSDVEQVKKKSLVPDYPSKYSGTGFAISQDGYVVTNLHVLNGFSKIFVFTSDNKGHQSEVVATDEINDLAILKITESDFSFSNKLPYAIKKVNPNIAQRIYSLGFPKNDIVYNEGYISSVTGFEGDSNRYQLELPSGPGVSGAPILDEFGNIIGIISGKQSESNGITFAIPSASLLNLIHALPKEFSSKQFQSANIKGLTRTQQIKQVQPFVCVVKVYN
ncbi:MAG: S1C family serine protease [Chitinophagaceae bacterium]